MAYFDLSRRLGIPDEDWSVGAITVSGGVNTSGGNAYARYMTCLVPPHCEVKFSVSYYIDPEDGTPYSGYINICEYGFNANFISGTLVESTSDKFHCPEGITITTSDKTAYIGVSARFITSAYNGVYLASCDSPWTLGSQNDGYPYNSQAEVLKGSQMIQPYPDSWWRKEAGYNDGYPFNRLMPDIPRTAGAFEDAALERVRIPNSTKTIGELAFSGTALRHVRIAADATYSETSFPSGCIVTRYPDDRYEQVYDGQGRMVLDRDARRILMRRTDDNG